MQRGETKYPPAQGTMPLRKAVRARLREETGVDYPEGRIIVGTGAKQVLYNGLAATLNEGDEVIIPAPTGCRTRTWCWSTAACPWR